MQNEGHLVDSTRNQAADPIPVVLCMTGVNIGPVHNRLSAAAGLIPEPFTPAALAAIVDDGKRAIVVFRTAEDYLAAAMGEGRTPVGALAEWMAEAAQVLKIRSQRRRQITLIRDLHVLQGENNGLGALQGFAGPALAANEAADESRALPLHRVLAQQMIASSPRAREIGQDLEASAPPWTPPAVEIDLDAVYADFVSAQARDSLLQDQITQLQDEIVGQVQQAERDREIWRLRVTELTATSETATSEIMTLKQMIAESELEVESLQQSIKKLKSELRQAQDAGLVARRHADSLEVERQMVFASTSWKITRPLRALKEKFSGGNGKKIV